MSSPRALVVPDADVHLVGEATLTEVAEAARNSARQRIILRYHRDHADPLHRMLNAMQPGTYVQPHRHLEPPKPEAFLVLRGAIAFFVFEDDGRLRGRVDLVAGSDTFGIDLAAGVYHALAPLETDTIIYEVKPGPWEAASDKDFAPWAPAEGDEGASAYLARLLEHPVGGLNG